MYIPFVLPSNLLSVNYYVISRVAGISPFELASTIISCGNGRSHIRLRLALFDMTIKLHYT